ncbi:MAG: dienelactone hydrolase family protein [Pseudomonadota bacterium]|nr:dienelactone hydrolase family protein [Pseudomonadota bacterium]
MKSLRSAVLCLLTALLALALSSRAAAQEHVSFPSLDGAANAPLVLVGEWFAAPQAQGPAPAVAMFHGCEGAYDKRRLLSRRLGDYAKLFNELGMHVLVVDSLSPRYETELCTQRVGRRRVTQTNRRLDALGALAYLAERPDVDAKRIGLIGWSNGGSTVLAATNQRHPDVAAAPTRPAFAVAFYPGCDSDLKRGYVPTAPLLLLLGGADDWTPAAPCRELAATSVAPRPEVETYAGAFHGFDSEAPLRLRKDVPNGVSPGQGVHVGGDAAALRASRERLRRFLAEH